MSVRESMDSRLRGNDVIFDGGGTRDSVPPTRVRREVTSQSGLTHAVKSRFRTLMLCGFALNPESWILNPSSFRRLNPESWTLNPGFQQRDFARGPLAELLI